MWFPLRRHIILRFQSSYSRILVARKIFEKDFDARAPTPARTLCDLRNSLWYWILFATYMQLYFSICPTRKSKKKLQHGRKMDPLKLTHYKCKVGGVPSFAGNMFPSLRKEYFINSCTVSVQTCNTASMFYSASTPNELMHRKKDIINYRLCTSIY